MRAAALLWQAANAGQGVEATGCKTTATAALWPCHPTGAFCARLHPDSRTRGLGVTHFSVL